MYTHTHLSVLRDVPRYMCAPLYLPTCLGTTTSSLARPSISYRCSTSSHPTGCCNATQAGKRGSLPTSGGSSRRAIAYTPFTHPYTLLHPLTRLHTPLHIRTHPYTFVRPLTHAHRCSTSTGRCACCSRGPTRHPVTRRPRYLSRCPRGAPAPTRASPTCTARAATRRRSGASRRSWRRRTAGRRRLPQALLLGRPKRKRRLRLVSSRADLFLCEIAARAVATPACTPGQGVHGAAQVQGAARPRDCESGGDEEGESSLYLFAYDDRKSRTPHATQSTPVSHTVSIII